MITWYIMNLIWDIPQCLVMLLYNFEQTKALARGPARSLLEITPKSQKHMDTLGLKYNSVNIRQTAVDDEERFSMVGSSSSDEVNETINKD